jgi:hypothetical protein
MHKVPTTEKRDGERNYGYKKTIWLPIVLGTAFGLLAGLGIITDLSFIVSGTNTDNLIGFWMILLLLSSALGGPLAGVIASILSLILTKFYGPPELQTIIFDPVIFWTNMFVLAMLMVFVAFAYRLFFERVNMPTRLLWWVGIVILVHVINIPANLMLQYYFHDETGVFPAILGSYKAYVPQVLFDIFVTSLVFIALPKAFAHPLWYELSKSRELVVETTVE